MHILAIRVGSNLAQLTSMLLIGALDPTIICFPLLFVLRVFQFEFLRFLQVSLLSCFTFLMEVANRFQHIIIKFVHRSRSFLLGSLIAFVFHFSNERRFERTSLSNLLVLLLFLELLLSPFLIQLFEPPMIKLNVFV